MLSNVESRPLVDVVKEIITGSRLLIQSLILVKMVVVILIFSV